eukprot:TRINITY_DN17489_c0_g1_i7.p1 TRINITY_DN17489_c0_g1~~TRINITY_DN17489_c0_g1_i7.p1  ORF type:complete len:641 (-),score=85.40 TRINITY_DN17489_c0_g1_i7:425-2101(-)
MTTMSASPWWQIYLGGSVEVQSVQLTGLPAGTAKPAAMKVSVDQHVCAASEFVPPGAPREIPCVSTGYFVKISTTQAGVLGFCNIKIKVHKKKACQETGRHLSVGQPSVGEGANKRQPRSAMSTLTTRQATDNKAKLGNSMRTKMLTEGEFLAWLRTRTTTSRVDLSWVAGKGQTTTNRSTTSTHCPRRRARTTLGNRTTTHGGSYRARTTLAIGTTTHGGSYPGCAVTTISGVDYHGYDIDFFDHIATPKSCAQSCIAVEGAAFYSFQSDTGFCSCKFSKAGARNASGFTSGTVCNPSQATTTRGAATTHGGSDPATSAMAPPGPPGTFQASTTRGAATTHGGKYPATSGMAPPAPPGSTRPFQDTCVATKENNVEIAGNDVNGFSQIKSADDCINKCSVVNGVNSYTYQPASRFCWCKSSRESAETSPGYISGNVCQAFATTRPNYSPPATTGMAPQATTGRAPLATTGMAPLATTGMAPQATTGRAPLADHGNGATGDHGNGSTRPGDNASETIAVQLSGTFENRWEIRREYNYPTLGIYVVDWSVYRRHRATVD